MNDANKVMRQTSFDFSSHVLGVESITPMIRRIECSVPEGFSFCAGQMAYLTRGDTLKRRATFAIASSPKVNGVQQASIEFLVEKTSRTGGEMAQKFFYEVKKSDAIEIKAPFGDTFMNEDTPIHKNFVFITSGSYVAAMKSMLEYCLETGFLHSLTLLIAVSNEEELLFLEEWEHQASVYPNFSYDFVVAEPMGAYNGHIGTLDVFYDRYVGENMDAFYYFSGTEMDAKENRMNLIKRRINEEMIKSIVY